jgi:hypothetical protein
MERARRGALCRTRLPSCVVPVSATRRCTVMSFRCGDRAPPFGTGDPFDSGNALSPE